MTGKFAEYAFSLKHLIYILHRVEHLFGWNFFDTNTLTGYFRCEYFVSFSVFEFGALINLKLFSI